MHECGAFAKWLVTQHVQLPLVGGEAQDGAQSGGLAGAVRTDEADDAAGLHGEIGAIQRDMRAILFCEISSFDERRHDDSQSSLASPPRGGGAGWVTAGVCANNSCAENPSLWMTARICGHSSCRNLSRSPASNSRRAPSLTYMPRPRRFSPRCSSTTCSYPSTTVTGFTRSSAP